MNEESAPSLMRLAWAFTVAYSLFAWWTIQRYFPVALLVASLIGAGFVLGRLSA